MDDILRWAASVGTIGAGLILAARVRPRITGWAFVVLSGASTIWIVVGYLTAESALMVQNVVVTLINLFGIYRWADLEGAGMKKPGAGAPQTLSWAQSNGVTEGWSLSDANLSA